MLHILFIYLFLYYIIYFAVAEWREDQS